MNAVTDNVVGTTVRSMDERLDILEDLLKSCQVSRIIDPVEHTHQSLLTHSDIIFRSCGMNGHETSECSSPSHKSSTCGASKSNLSTKQLCQLLLS